MYRRLGGTKGRSGEVGKISLPPEFDPRTVKPVASCNTDYTIAAANVTGNLHIMYYLHIMYFRVRKSAGAEDY